MIFESLAAFHHKALEYKALNVFVMKCCDKNVQYYIFCRFVTKCCKDSKNHCWKVWKSSILMYFNILWWIDWGFQKLVSKNFEKLYFFMYSIILWWNDNFEMRILKKFNAYFVGKWCEDFKNHCRKIWKIISLMYYEDFKKHYCWKIGKQKSILLYSICDKMMWGFQKSLSKIFNFYVLYCFVMQ